MPKTLPSVDIVRLLKSPVLEYDNLKTEFRKNIYIRNNAIIELLYCTGVRIGELVGIDLKDLNTAEQTLLIHGKGRDDIFVDLIDEALDKINEASYYVYNLDMKAKEKITLTLTELYKTIETSEGFRQTCSLIAQAMNSAAIPEKAQRIISEKRDISYEIFAKIMKEGQAENTIVEGNPEDLAILFWSTVDGLTIFNATRPLPCRLPDKGFIESMFFIAYRETTGNAKL